MIGKLVLTILVAMTINMSVDKPIETNLLGSDESVYDENGIIGVLGIDAFIE